MNPCKKSCGIVTVIQSQFWGLIKKILPQFSQGDDKEALIERIKTMVETPEDVNMSCDGSAFDST